MKICKEINLYLLSGLIITALGITIAAIIFEQSIFRILPLYISLFVSILQSKVSRFASLLGGINSIIYALVYFYYCLYGAFLSAVLFSFPMQIITFINWSKNQENNEVRFKKLRGFYRILLTLVYIIAVLVSYYFLSKTDNGYPLLDSLSSVMGILVLILTIFPFIEYTALIICNSLLNIVLYICMIQSTPEQTTFLIYSLYSLVCLIFAILKAIKIYKLQQKGI